MPVVGPPTSPGGEGTTVSDLIEETKRLLYGSGRQSINRLPAGGINSEQDVITMELDLNDIVRGALLSVENELMYVISAAPASKQVTVMRGYMGTEAVEHAQDVYVEVNPRFPRIYIKDALRREIDSWGSRLFKVTSTNIALSVTTRSYDLGISDFLAVLSVRFSPYIGRTTHSNVLRWHLLTDQDTVDFPSGAAIELLGEYPNTGSMRVTLAQKFDVSVWDDNTVVESIGLRSSMIDIPPIGAAWRLMATKEIARTSMVAQPEPRRSEEVPAGHIASVGAQLKKLRDDRIEEERWTLLQTYPLRGVA